MNWLFTQDRKNVVWVYMMKPGIYRFDDWFMSSCYLILGKEKALLIDTTMAHQRLLPIIQKITALPVYLAITHPHMDHMLQAYDYDTIYIHEDAASTIENQLETMYKMLSEGGAMKINTHMIPPFMKDAMKLHTVKPIQEGWKIDLGGDCWIEARFVGGHTPYDLVFIDYLHHAVFTGDAVGSGYVVGVNYPASKFNEAYEKYRDNLQRLIDYIEPKGEFTYYGGHYIQENSCEDAWQEDYLNGQSQFFVPLTFGLIQDMKVLCDKLLQGDYSEQISKEDGSFFVSWGDASLSARRIEKK